MSQREQWRAYIVGLSTGKVPDDIDLLPHEVKRIQGEIDRYIDRMDKFRESTMTKDSGIGGSIDDSFQAEEETLTVAAGEISKEQYSWYFGQCSREEAEAILTKNYNYGNTLMRQKTSDTGQRQYVVSTCDWADGLPRFEHYMVLKTLGGYKIDAKNVHDELKTLAEVMDYLVDKLGGHEVCRPMETNDLKRLGCDNSNYATRIPEASSINTVKQITRPLPPVPFQSTDKKPKPFLKASSEGQLKGLRQPTHGTVQDNNSEKSNLSSVIADCFKGSSLSVHSDGQKSDNISFKNIPELPKKSVARRNSESAAHGSKTEGLSPIFKQKLSNLFSGSRSCTTSNSSGSGYETTSNFQQKTVQSSSSLPRIESHIYTEAENI